MLSPLDLVAYIPHGHCYLWELPLVRLHIVSDALTALAYYSIPITLVVFIRRRPDIPFPWLFGLFGAFIFICGTSHLMAIWTLWHPDYWASGVIKALTAGISVLTAVQLVPVIPQALALPSPEQLETMNRQLQHEVEERRLAEAALSSLFASMHDLVLVRDRTGRCLSIAPTQFKSWVRPQEEMLNRTLHDVMPVAEADRLLASIRAALDTHNSVSCDYCLTINGEDTWFSASIAAMEADKAVLVVRDISARKRAEDALKLSQQRLQLALEASGDGLWDWNIDTGSLYFSAHWLTMLGYAADELPHHVETWQELMHPEERSQVMQRLSAYLSGNAATYNFEYRLRTRSGQWKWVANYGKVVGWNAQGNPTRMVGTHRDITERKQAEAMIQESEARFRSAFDNADIGMALVAHNGQFLRVNQACCDILGYSAEEILSLNIQSISHPDDQGDDWTRVRRLLTEGDRPYRAERRYLSPSGDVIWVVLGVSAVRDAEGEPRYFVSQIQDDTARRLYEAQLAHQAFYDSLTRLPNRSLFCKHLEEEVHKAQRHLDYRFAVFFMDLDRFKLINDSLGHAAGDGLLMAVGRRLQRVIREVDLVARFGGDEFAILLTDVRSLAGVFQVADRILQEFQRPFVLRNSEYVIGSSIGITLNTIENMTPDGLLQAADIALYRAKNQGRGQYDLYDREMGEQVRDQIRIEAVLRNAIE